ncbi:Fusicoccadiene C-8 hydroxylase [Paramyrothecium foliicola]|nr:Fusicoccadiene C-8 hydroxylase [Paramyrothecium foliicola]
MLSLKSVASWDKMYLHLFLVFLATWLYFIVLIIYRLRFSPVARFPGPKLAAITSWYKFYYDWCLGGKFVFHLEQLHKKYGPIVRINPWELSIQDSRFYDEIYVSASKRRTDLPSSFMNGVGFEDSFFLSRKHDLHKMRRQPFQKTFSRKGIQGIQPLLAELVMTLESRLNDYRGTNQDIRLDHALTCYTSDVIETLYFGSGNPALGHRLYDAQFSPEWASISRDMIRLTPLLTAFPWINSLMKMVPKRILGKLLPQGQVFNVFIQKARHFIREAKIEYTKQDLGSISLIHQVLQSDMPESEKSLDRLTKDVQVMLSAGSEESASAMALGIVHILSQPDLKHRLSEELRDVMSQWPRRIPSLNELESLPVLQATVKEIMRLSFGAMGRLPRVFPDTPIYYKGYEIPAGVSVGMAAYFMHTDPHVYESPFEFKPERWIGDINPAMKRNLVPFSRGSRSCLGEHLALAEINLVLAMIFNPNGPKLALFNTTIADVEKVQDIFIALPRPDSKGVRVSVLA